MAYVADEPRHSAGVLGDRQHGWKDRLDPNGWERTEGGPMRSVLVALGALMMTTAGCGQGGADGLPWPGTVHAEVDDLTGARTGLFRTYGPTQPLIAGGEAIPVTAGYWCQVDEDREPAAVTDGLFFRVAMPDTSLVSDGREAFEELSGHLGLLDVARLAVDGRVYAWEYEPRPKTGAWFLDGVMGFEPHHEFDTARERDQLLGSLAGVPSTAIQIIGEAWPLAHDYVASHYVGRDTVGIELKRVLKFSLQGFAAANPHFSHRQAEDRGRGRKAGLEPSQRGQPRRGAENRRTTRGFIASGGRTGAGRTL